MLEKAIRRDFVGRENLQSINYTGKQYWKYNVSIDCGTRTAVSSNVPDS